MTSEVAKAIRPSLASRQIPLRIGVVFGHQVSEVATRLVDVIDLLARTEGVHLQNVYRFPDRAVSSSAVLFRLYQKMATFRGNPSPVFEFQHRLEKFPLATLVGENGVLAQRDFEIVSRDDLDILVWLGEPPPAGDCSHLARRAVLSLCFGEPERARRQPPYFREDTTPFHLDGIWYFFTFTLERPQELYLFYSRSLAA